MNIFLSPEQYACMLIDIAEESATNQHGIAIGILEDAVPIYNMPNSYVTAVNAALDRWVIDGKRPA